MPERADDRTDVQAHGHQQQARRGHLRTSR
jgi:hypothetical protein